MLLDAPHIADFLALRDTRQFKIDQRLLRANAQRIPKDYRVNDQVCVRALPKGRKMNMPWEGPFPVIRVHTNGALTYARPNGAHERLSIRHIKPST